VVEVLNRFQPVYLHVIEGETGGPRDIDPGFDFHRLRRLFQRTYMANNGYTLDLAIETLDAGLADLISFGVPFIANADLVERLRSGAPLDAPDPTTFYGGGEKGYTDYPTLGAGSNIGSRPVETTGVAQVLEGNEISRIKLDTKRKDGLSEALDDNIAREEQDEELEEEEAVEAAAGANRG
jgi:hypothetical protein